MAVSPLIVEQMRAALEAHDLDRFLEFFHEDYAGERPRHPGSPRSNRDEVRANWAEIIRDVPDLRIDIPASCQDGDTVWSEWEHTGTRRDGPHPDRADYNSFASLSDPDGNLWLVQERGFSG